MSAEDVLFLTPEDDLNNHNDSIDKSKILTESFESKNSENVEQENQNVSVNDNFVELNATKNNEDELHETLPNEENDQIESGEIGEIKNENVPPVKIDENLLNEMKYLFKNTRYFLIKSNNYENVFLAQSKSVWSTPRANEIKLNKAYRECANVILIFSVSESGRFQGYARLASESRLDPDLQVDWILPPTLSARSLMGVFKIDWITKNDLFFNKTQHLLNSWNENRQVKVGRDGQEIEPHCGESLCRLFDLSSSNDSESKIEEINKNLSLIIKRSKRKHEELLENPEKRDSREKKSRSRSSSRGSRGSKSSRKDERRSSERDREKSKGDLKDQDTNLDRDYHRYKKDYHQQYRKRYDDRGIYHNRPFYNQARHMTSIVQPPYYPPTGQPFVSHGMPHQIENIPFKRHRSRSSSPRRKEKDISKLDLPKDIVLNSTYEEYLQAMKQQQHQQIYPIQQGPYGGYEQNYYQNIQYGYGMQQQQALPINPSMQGYNLNEYTQPTNPSKYDQDVEEFLRQTSAPVISERKEKAREKESRDKKKEKKRDKESRRRKSRSSSSRSKSRDRSYRRKSKSRSRDRR
ncbi:unnamed protein product [Brachionus calyciflorus]|uniref:YTH domain-containing protein n=1 Tax=Brachionus calyciflorus TaxID=104777 RepID=A0A814CP88_9BILA|nr:unnamed protein product [Brachionus calyciflorus]